MPDGLDQLKGRERLNLLKFVCSFAWADLEIRSEERRFIKRLVERLELDPDEALVIEVRMTVEPEYLGFHLSNLWGESLDYANHVASLNGFQARRDADGAVRYVVAHRDPGLANWVDTTGPPEGYLTVRWSYSQKQQELPEVAVRKLRFGDLEKALPAPLLKLSKEERIEQVRIRQQHVQRRYRQY